MNRIELVARRRALGLTQTELAELLGLSQSAIGRYETGRANPESLNTALARIEARLAADVAARVTGYYADGAPLEISAANRLTAASALEHVAAARAADQIRRENLYPAAGLPAPRITARHA